MINRICRRRAFLGKTVLLPNLFSRRVYCWSITKKCRNSIQTLVILLVGQISLIFSLENKKELFSAVLLHQLAEIHQANARIVHLVEANIIRVR